MKNILILLVGVLLGMGISSYFILAKIYDAPYSVFRITGMLQGHMKHWEKYNDEIDISKHKIIDIDYYRIVELDNFKNIFDRIDSHEITTEYKNYTISGTDVIYAIREGTVTEVNFNKKHKTYTILVLQMNKKVFTYSNLKSVGKNIIVGNKINGGEFIGRAGISEAEAAIELKKLNQIYFNRDIINGEI